MCTVGCDRMFLSLIVQNRDSVVHLVGVFEGVLDRHGSVGIATRYGLDGPGIESRWLARFSAPV